MKIEIDGKEIQVAEGSTLYDICRSAGITIPTLCYHASLKPSEARCRVCLVEMDGRLVTSCSTCPKEGSRVVTRSERVLKARRLNMELMVPKPSCNPEDDFEVCEIYRQVGMRKGRVGQSRNHLPDLGASVIRDDNLCINCGRCVRVCAEVQGIYAIDFAGRAHNEHVTPYCEKRLH